VQLAETFTFDIKCSPLKIMQQTSIVYLIYSQYSFAVKEMPPLCLSNALLLSA